MKVALIGGAGFLGTALRKLCLEGGWEVVVYDLPALADTVRDVPFQALDLLKDEIFYPSGTQAVYYLAQSPFYRLFPNRADHLFSVNVLGAVKAAQAAYRQGGMFFCYASSGNVYQPAFHPLSEGHPVRRDDPYALSKRTAEEALQLFSPPLRTLSVRIFGLFGPNQKTNLPVKIREKLGKREPIFLHPAPGQNGQTDGLVVSFCYVNDAARCLMALADKAVGGQSLPPILNIAGPEAISLRHFATVLGQFLHIDPVFQVMPNRRTFDLIADVQLLRTLINPSFTPFEEAMAWTFYK
jgi:UDP-glucose 4-epimerase